MTSWWQWRTRRAERRAALAAQLREREGLVSAADWAITSAREWWPGYGEPEWVTVADVVARALEDEGLEVTEAAAAAVLRERLELRGRFGLRTDAELILDIQFTKCVECSDEGEALVDPSRPELGRLCEWHLVSQQQRQHHARELEDEDQDPELPPGIISSVVHKDDDAKYFKRKLLGEDR